MASAAPALPNAGLEYPVELGRSFQADRDSAGGLCLLQYAFKPASAGRFQDGRVCVDADQQKVLLQLPNSASQASDMDFTGLYEPSRDGLDCVASFDGSCWHLDLVDAVARNIRNVKGSFPLPPEPAPAHAQPAEHQPHAQHAQQQQLAMAMVEDLDAPDPEPEGQAAERSPSPAPHEDFGTDKARQGSDGGESERDLEDMMQEEENGDATEKEPLEQQQQLSEKSSQQLKLIPRERSRSPQQARAAKAHTPAQPQHQAHANLGAMEREFLGGPSDSDVDEEELNRCSDDDVDGDFDA